MTSLERMSAMICCRSDSPHSDRPLRVALVSSASLWHGGEGQLWHLATQLRRSGHIVSVVARRNGRFAARMASDGFAVTYMWGRGRNPLAVWQLRRHLKEFCADIVYVNDAHAATAGSLAAVGMPAVKLAARRVDFPIRSAAKYRHGYDRVICVSHEVARVCTRGGIPERQLRVVHEGVDPQRILAGDRERGRRAIGIADDQPLLLSVATLTDHKGHRFLIDALPAVVARYPRLCLALAGDGELTEPLQRQVRSLGLERHVRFLGFRHDIPDLMLGCDVFVIASHMEGLCTSIVDAMFASRTIVTTTAGGIPDLVGARGPGDGAIAWMAAPRDSQSLARELIAALDATPAERAAVGARAAERAARYFTAERMAAGTLDVYRDVLASRRDVA